MEETLFDPHRFAGTVSRVAHASAEIALREAPVDQNSREAQADIGAFILVDCGKTAVFGRIIDIYYGQAASGGALIDGCKTARVELLNSIDTSSGEVTAGLNSYPLVGEMVYLATAEIARYVIESRNRAAYGDTPITLSIASLTRSPDTVLHFTPEMLFGRHLAVLGTTGAGKSWSLARIMEEAAKHRSKILLFDASGEFGTLKKGVRHLHIGNHPNPPAHSEEASLPYYQLTESDLFAIFKPTGESQAPKLRAAMRSLKLAHVALSTFPDGLIQKVHKEKRTYEREYRRHIEAIESPFAKFDIRNLARQIENECVNPSRSTMEPQFWGDYNAKDQALCTPLIARIEDIIRSPNLEPIFKPGRRLSLLKAFNQFMEDDSLRILRINLKYLAYEHHAREIVANAVGRHLLTLARDEFFKTQPLLVIVDEAHQFLNKAVESEEGAYPLDSFGTIAKEGRKYALNICMATQRPRDIPESVISQMGTLLVHRLINDQDLSVVERASGEIDRTSLAAIPNLTAGEAILIGVDFPIPVTVRITAPEAKPSSEGPAYQKHWRQ
ncbi:MAG: ATP-binding protein [Candidatus Dadabacteria bacterium]|nr:MAG: ATP-binding protein [Candidatus Dadabacteria bacterium]